MAEKIWFITGAARGFGRIWTEAALETGDKVAATVRERSDLDELVATYGDHCLTLQVDVTDRDGVLALLTKLTSASVGLMSSSAMPVTALWARSERSRSKTPAPIRNERPWQAEFDSGYLTKPIWNGCAGGSRSCLPLRGRYAKAPAATLIPARPCREFPLSRPARPALL
jgi:NAD(P)-dependent dehydrogenase (short-subunit alcohol dehydrogenase family)